MTASFVIKQETRTEGRRSNRYEFINDPRNRSWSLTVEWDGGEAVGKGGGKRKKKSCVCFHAGVLRLTRNHITTERPEDSVAGAIKMTFPDQNIVLKRTSQVQ